MHTHKLADTSMPQTNKKKFKCSIKNMTKNTVLTKKQIIVG